MAEANQVQQIDTPLGPFLARWSSVGLYAFEFLKTGQEIWPDEAANLPADWGRKLLLAVQRYFESGVMDWHLDLLDWTGISPFHQRVLAACYQIAPGETLTYGQLAYRSGSSQAARAVGGAMARNRWPLIIPCHRVVGSGGRLTGYSGVGGIQTKQWLLDFESSASNRRD